MLPWFGETDEGRRDAGVVWRCAAAARDGAAAAGNSVERGRRIPLAAGRQGRGKASTEKRGIERGMGDPDRTDLQRTKWVGDGTVLIISENRQGHCSLWQLACLNSEYFLLVNIGMSRATCAIRAADEFAVSVLMERGPGIWRRAASGQCGSSRLPEAMFSVVCMTAFTLCALRWIGLLRGPLRAWGPRCLSSSQAQYCQRLLSPTPCPAALLRTAPFSCGSRQALTRAVWT
jgi:hypothetical protein